MSFLEKFWGALKETNIYMKQSKIKKFQQITQTPSTHIAPLKQISLSSSIGGCE